MNKSKKFKKVNKCRHLWATIEHQRKTEILSNHRYFWFNTSEEVLSGAFKNQAKIPSEDCIQGGHSYSPSL